MRCAEKKKKEEEDDSSFDSENFNFKNVVKKCLIYRNRDVINELQEDENCIV